MMFTSCLLVRRSICRNPVRTMLTGLGISVLACIYAVAFSVNSALATSVNDAGSQNRLICSDRWLAPSQIPPRYLADLAAEDGVDDWTTWNLFACYFDTSFRTDRMGIGICTRPENLGSMFTNGDRIEPDALEKPKTQRDGALIASSTMRIMNWRVGQQITFYGAQYPRRSVPLTIVGELPPGQLVHFYFRQDYLEQVDATRVMVNAVILKVCDATKLSSVAASIHDRYTTLGPALKVETESAGVARLATRMETVLDIIHMATWILFIDMVLILSNSISISVRERREEMAVLKVLGFQPYQIMALVVAEAMSVGALAGCIGTTFIYLVSSLTLGEVLPVTFATRYIIQFPVPHAVIGQGLLLGILVGLIGSLFPALAARKINIWDVFAKAG